MELSASRNALMIGSRFAQSSNFVTDRSRFIRVRSAKQAIAQRDAPNGALQFWLPSLLTQRYVPGT